MTILIISYKYILFSNIRFYIVNYRMYYINIEISFILLIKKLKKIIINK